MTTSEQDIAAIHAEIVAELRRAQDKHPGWPDDVVHACAIVNEEAGELIQAGLDFYYEGKREYAPRNMLFGNMRREAIQVGAMALRFLLNIEKHWKCRND